MMNFRLVFNQLSLLLVVLSLVLLVMAGGFFGLGAVSGFSIDSEARLSFIMTGGSGLLAFGGLWLLTRRGSVRIGRREALLLVALSWMLGATFCALPYYFWAMLSTAAGETHPFSSFAGCLFEATSGLTTTGASVLGSEGSAIEALPKSLLLWRSITHWIGGLGIVVLFVAVLPSLGVGGKRLYRLEAPGPTKDRFHPQVRETARILWKIYVGLTIVQILLLKIFGMTWFDAICHTFSTLATGGFSPRDASVGAYDSMWIRSIIIVFMFLGGMNFALMYEISRRRFARVLHDPELRIYIIILLASMAIITFSLLFYEYPITTSTGEVLPTTVGLAASESAFTVLSIQSTTGFATSDYNQWPFVAKSVIVFLMFVGGCSGSTAGGIKVIRVWIALRILWGELEKVFRPQVVRPIRVGRSAIDPEMKLAVVSYTLGIIVLFAIGGVVIHLLEGERVSLESTATATLSCLCTIGPGLGQVGPVANFGWMSGPSWVLLSAFMIIGRLEVFAILVLLSPRFWKTD